MKVQKQPARKPQTQQAGAQPSFEALVPAEGEQTPVIEKRVEAVTLKLKKLVKPKDASTFRCDIELGKTTRHHRHGNVFRAEINLRVAGQEFRAVEEGETLLAALDSAYDEIKNAFVHAKQKKQNSIRRGGAQGKDLLRRG